MIPYADFLYFGVLLYVVVPTVILGLIGRASRRWTLLATVCMLVVQYGGRLRVEPGREIREIWILAAFALFEWGVAQGFLLVRARGRRRWAFYSALLLALVPLVLAKYVPLVAPHFQFGFLGISYVTFRSLDVIICTQDGLITALPPGEFLAYLLFFGTISSGPIDRYRRFAGDWRHRRSREEFLCDLDAAVHRMFTGFFYKFIVAALVKQYWLDPVASRSGTIGLLSYMYAYSAYLFFDFAGYSAFAIGVSYLFGVHTPENFDRPFLARNIRDFWNRWHITLSWWLRDHIYMRFVMAAKKGRWFKSRYRASYIGLFLAFGLMGVWHGVEPHYLLYGVYHGALLSMHEAFSRWNARRKLWGDGPLWQAAAVFATFQCVCFGFLLFSGHLTGGDGASRGLASGEGQYEKASCAELSGWAWDPLHPEVPVDVDISADGRRLATVRADLFRQDLADGGKGNGAHAFLYVPPASVKDGWRHATMARISGTTIDLSPMPRPIVCGMNPEALDGYDGSHDTADCESMSGWAWDVTRPEHPVDVDVYDEGGLLGTVHADQLREERRNSGYGNGKHGFVFPTPARLRDGRPHSVSVQIAGTNIALRHTPQVITCLARPALPPITASAYPTESEAAGIGGTAAPPPGAATPVAENAAGTKEHGPAPSYVDNRDGTISALHTGLMWEKKVKLDGHVDATNLQDADNCYPWAGTCATGAAQCRVDADCGDQGPCNADDCQASAPAGLTIFKWVAQLNAAAFAGHSDWRMPTSQELYGIVNPMEEGDAATRAAFDGGSCGGACNDLGDAACSCNQPGLYWAASQRAIDPDSSWMSLFYCNGNLFLDLRANKFYVRAVRGGGS